MECVKTVVEYGTSENALLIVNTNDTLSDNTRQSYRDACRRWGCDYVEVLSAEIDYHPAALKLRAFECCDYERLFIVDSDAIIRSDTPNIFECTLPENYYAVKNQQPHFPPAYLVNVDIARQEIEAIEKIKGKLDIPKDWIAENFFNSGVCVCSRTAHRATLQKAFDLFCGSPLQWWDQIPLNIAVYLDCGKYRDLGADWNYQFPSNMSRMQSYIYHFAGNPNRYALMENVVWERVIDSINTREQLPKITNTLGLLRGVEVGTQKGEYAEQLLANSNLEELIVVDSWEPMENYNDIANVTLDKHLRNKAECEQRLAPFGSRAKIMHMFSHEAAELIEDESLDFVYLDANHSHTGILHDLVLWYPKLRTGGVMSGHDFLEGPNLYGSEFGVKSAVFKFLEQTKDVLYVTDEYFASFWFIKGGEVWST